MWHKKKTIIFFIVALCAAGFILYRFVRHSQSKLPFSHTSFDRYIAEVMKTFHVPGLSIAIIENDAIVFMKGYGVIEVGKSDLVDVDTVFPIGSCTKAFTAAALGLLVDEGKITWNDQVHRYLPNFKLYDPYVTKELMISDMLSHRSGIEDLGLLYYRTKFSREQLIYQLRYLPPAVGFRVSGIYNNLMYLASGQIIPAVTGMSWDEFVVKRLFMPLGMNSSYTSIDQLEGRENIAQPHIFVENVMRVIPFLNINNAAPAGSINAPIKDMAQWVRMLVNNGNYADSQIIKSDTIQQIYSPQSIMGKGHPYGLYGFGWGLSDYYGHKTIVHKGSIDGMSSIIGILPDKNVGIVVLTNTHENDARLIILNYLFDRYLGKESPVDWADQQRAKENKGLAMAQQEKEKIINERIEGTAPSFSLAEYVGSYVNDLYGQMTISQDGDYLRTIFLGFNGKLVHWNYDTFMFDSSRDYPAIGDMFFLKFNIKNKNVNGVSINISGNKDAIFKKIK